MEVLFIKPAILELEKDYTCESFNEIKFKLAKVRKNSYFSFLQITRPSGYNKLFYLSLLKNNKTAKFETMKYPVDLIVKKNRLRALEETEELDGFEVECIVGNETNNAATYECQNNVQKIPFKIDINNNNISNT